uniref:Tumor necrosis factor receptor superfamily member 18 n=1 Tax=Pogona vitticeps TaxID=103695 RepID=A0A6J0SNJ7_9SAUR
MMGSPSPSRPDRCLFCFLAFWFCMKLGVTIQKEVEPICCIQSPQGAHPNSCGACGLGECCADKQCTQCRKLPKCQEGEEIFCSGTLDFRYSCKQCPNGTYLDTKNGCCVPWTDCETLGLRTHRPGNRTHNVRCGQEPETVAAQPDCATAAESTVTTILTVLTAAGIFVLVLLTFILIICTWRQKETLPLDEEPESANQPRPLGAQLLREDTYSCQFPEEEQGCKMEEE